MWKMAIPNDERLRDEISSEYNQVFIGELSISQELHDSLSFYRGMSPMEGQNWAAAHAKDQDLKSLLIALEFSDTSEVWRKDSIEHLFTQVPGLKLFLQALNMSVPQFAHAVKGDRFIAEELAMWKKAASKEIKWRKEYIKEAKKKFASQNDIPKN